MKIFLDGKMAGADKRQLDDLAPGRLKGLGMFETMRTVGGEPFLLDEHLRRMTRGLKLIGLKNPFTPDRWRKLIHETMKANHLRQARIRLTVWKDGSRRHASVICRPLVLPLAEQYRRGRHVIVSSVRRPLSRLSHVKSTDYGVFLKAQEEAKHRGADEALMLNVKGHVVEAARSNIFWIRNNTLFTPAVSTGCLNGITRRIIVTLARERGWKVSIVEAPLNDLLRADSVFLTNSIVGVMPVRSIK